MCHIHWTWQRGEKGTFAKFFSFIVLTIRQDNAIENEMVRAQIQSESRRFTSFTLERKPASRAAGARHQAWLANKWADKTNAKQYNQNKTPENCARATRNVPKTRVHAARLLFRRWPEIYAHRHNKSKKAANMSKKCGKEVSESRHAHTHANV